MCTRILWNDNALAVFVGRTMDWPESTQPRLVVFPRGIQRLGGRLFGEEVVSANPLNWTSSYGSIVTTLYAQGAADGLNERGLGVHLLAFGQADYGIRDPRRPGLHAGLWAQYLLDNAASVAEAVALHDTLQLVMVTYRGFPAAVHIAVEDATGDSAIIEYIDGEAVIHHGRQYTVMTNDPSYGEQLALLAQQDFSNPSRDMPLPGNVNPIDRFQRAAYFRAVLPEPKNERAGVAGVLAIARNASVPFGAPYKTGGAFATYNSEYRTASNLTDRHYYFELSDSPNVVWAHLDDFDLTEGAPVMSLDPDDIALSGNVGSRFEATAAPY